ncbi:uncharacterized protein LOC108678143 [Hyalella azteca]|uniref:Uncharacterized protein LOC108678143 n=1 Tax=Hyalella azteca TaxID=294128 RepID=A0A8B7P738_HYAAZ|nr:uncharacterized protein LOC108678143 [Hyalella azteca]
MPGVIRRPSAKVLHSRPQAPNVSPRFGNSSPITRQAFAHQNSSLRKKNCHAKHKKDLACGKQVKTHLRCQHLIQRPAWGSTLYGNTDESDILAKRKALQQQIIDRKIDRMCATKNIKEFAPQPPARDVEAGRKSVSNVISKHKKTMTNGNQLKTHLRCEHLSPDPALITSRRRKSHVSHDKVKTGRKCNYYEAIYDQSVRVASQVRQSNEREIFVDMPSPEDVPVLEISVPPAVNYDNSRISTPSPCSSKFNSRISNLDSSQKRVRFDDEIQRSYKYCPEADGSNSSGRNSPLLHDAGTTEVDFTNTTDISYELCKKKFPMRPSPPRGDFWCQFCGKEYPPKGHKFCNFCKSGRNCWAVKAYENLVSDGTIGVAACGAHGRLDEERPSVSFDESYRRGPAVLPRPPTALKHQCVHQYHQNSRLFLEPTFPDERGDSSCLLCGRNDTGHRVYGNGEQAARQMHRDGISSDAADCARPTQPRLAHGESRTTTSASGDPRDASVPAMPSEINTEFNSGKKSVPNEQAKSNKRYSLRSDRRTSPSGSPFNSRDAPIYRLSVDYVMKPPYSSTQLRKLPKRNHAHSMALQDHI